MKIKYSVKKILGFEDARDGFCLVLGTSTDNIETSPCIYLLRNPHIRKDGNLIWDNNTRGWNKKSGKYKILTPQQGEIFMKTHNLTISNPKI